MLSAILLTLISLKEPSRLLEQVRGVPAPADLKVESLPREQIRPFLEQAIQDSYGDRFDALARLYQALRLIPGDVDARKALLDLYQSQVAAFYNPKDHTMKVIEGLDPDQPLLKILLVHELTHALQDKRLPLFRLMQERSDSRDRSLALQTLLEGEAVLVMTMASLEETPSGPPPDAKERMARLEKSLGLYAQDFSGLVPDAPRFFVHDLLIPYQAGVRYVFAAYKRGGWKAVDALYGHPPQCMEEILHPETKTTCPSLDAAAFRLSLPGFEPLSRDNFGETGFEYMFQGLENETLRGAAAGWDGDEAVLHKGKQGEAVLWLTRWDTLKDRDGAVAALQAYAKKQGLTLRPVPAGRTVLFMIAAGPLPDLPQATSAILRSLDSDSGRPSARR
jgi:hypothetical protein